MKLKDVVRDRTLFVEIGRLVFVWSGGPYIDILNRRENGDVSYSEENINVWDYETGEARIPFTSEALIDRCFSWMNE